MPGLSYVPFYADIQLRGNELCSARPQLITSKTDFEVLKDGNLGYNATVGDRRLWFYDEALDSLVKVPRLDRDESVTGLFTFSRSTNAPFACVSGSAKVTNLDSDLLDGLHAATGTTGSTIAARDSSGRIQAADPAANSDVTTKSWVENYVGQRSPKDSVKVVTSANITLSGLQTIDSYTLLDGDRVLVRSQTAPAENGIYEADAAGWTRTADADTWDEMISAYVWVERGTVGGDTGWLCTIDDGGTLGVDPVTWTQQSGAAQITAGRGIVKDGNVLHAIQSTAYTTNAVLYASDADAIGFVPLNSTSTQKYLRQVSSGAPTWETLHADDITAGTLAMARGGTGSSLADPDADRLLFWDDSAGAMTWLSLGTYLTISGTTLSGSNIQAYQTHKSWSAYAYHEVYGWKPSGTPNTGCLVITFPTSFIPSNTATITLRLEGHHPHGYGCAAWSMVLSAVYNSGYASKFVGICPPQIYGQAPQTRFRVGKNSSGTPVFVLGDTTDSTNVISYYVRDVITYTAEGYPPVDPAGMTMAYASSLTGYTLLGWDYGSMNYQAAAPLCGNNGTVARPGYMFAGDYDTGMYLSSAGVLGFVTGGTEWLTIYANGNVGIGVTDPDAKLEVNGQVKITGGTPGLNKVLTSDADGLASWTTVTTLADHGDLGGLADDDHTQYLLLSGRTSTGGQTIYGGTGPGDNLTFHSTSNATKGLFIFPELNPGVLSIGGDDGELVTETTLAMVRGGTGAALTDPNADRILFWDDSASAMTWLTVGTGFAITETTINFAPGDIDHGSLGGLTDDDHTQYAKLAGRSGGQTIIGGTGVGDDLAFETTSNATKGSYIFTELGPGPVFVGDVDHTLYTTGTWGYTNQVLVTTGTNPPCAWTYIENDHVATAAAIAWSKLATGTASSMAMTSALGVLTTLTNGTVGQFLRIGSGGTPEWGTYGAGSIDHGGLIGLSDDDHAQYALLAGRSGGQTLIGGTAAGDDLTFDSTSNATKGFVQIQPTGGYVAIGNITPTCALMVRASGSDYYAARFANAAGTVVCWVDVNNSCYSATAFRIGDGSSGLFNAGTLQLRSDRYVEWSSTTNATQTKDTRLYRYAAGVVRVQNPNASTDGDLLAGKIGLGIYSPTRPLSFADSAGEKISLCSVSATARDYYGFAYETGLLVAQMPTGGEYRLYANATSVLCSSAAETTIYSTDVNINCLTHAGTYELVRVDYDGYLSSTLELPSGLTVGGSTLHLAAHYADKITGTGALSSFTITHNMGTRDVVVAIIDTTTGTNQYYAVQTAWKADTTNTVIVYFNTPPPSGTTYRVTVIGYK